MSPDTWRFRIRDILDSVARIERYTRDLSWDAFRGDDKTADAVLRNLEIIGEAARYVPPEIQVRHAHIPWREMQALRNIVVHEYHGVNLEIIWRTVQEDLPSIVTPLQQILKHED